MSQSELASFLEHRLRPKLHRTKRIRKQKFTPVFTDKHSLAQNNKSKGSKATAILSDGRRADRSRKLASQPLRFLGQEDVTPKTTSASSENKQTLSSSTVQNSQIQIGNQQTLRFSSNIGDVGQYLEGIQNYCLSVESQPLDVQRFASIQKQISLRNRMEMIQFIQDAQKRFDLMLETQHLAVEVLDRTLTTVQIALPDLETLAISCLSISWKYHQVKLWEVQYVLQELQLDILPSRIVELESIILIGLDWKLNLFSSIEFIGLMVNTDTEVKISACLIVELVTKNFQFRRFKPSIVAFASVLIAQDLLDLRYDGSWISQQAMLCKKLIRDSLKSQGEIDPKVVQQRALMYRRHFGGDMQ